MVEGAKMPITTMTGRENAFDAEGNLKPNVRIVRDYNGAEEGVHHSKTCPHAATRRGVHKALTPECVAVKWHKLPDDPATHSYGRGYSAEVDPVTGEFKLDGNGNPIKSALGYSGDACHVCEPLYMETTHVGVVLSADGERNGYDDSDFYATIWNGKEPVEVTYATTRGWTYPNHAEADATPEVWAAFRAWNEARAEADRKAREIAAEEAAMHTAHEPKVGAYCTVVKGRKVPVGTSGTCTWKGDSAYGERVGLKDAFGVMHYTAASNVERVVEKPEGMTWVAFVASEIRVLPLRGDVLRVTSGPRVGTVGTCFWTEGNKVGLTPSGRKSKGRYTDAVYVMTHEVAKVELVA